MLANTRFRRRINDCKPKRHYGPKEPELPSRAFGSGQLETSHDGAHGVLDIIDLDLVVRQVVITVLEQGFPEHAPETAALGPFLNLSLEDEPNSILDCGPNAAPLRVSRREYRMEGAQRFQTRRGGSDARIRNQ